MRYSWMGMAVVALIFAAPSPAQPLGVGLGMGRGMRMAGPQAQAGMAAQPQAFTALKDALGLTDQQVQQLIDMRKQVAESNKSLAEQIQAKRQEIANLMNSANPDPAKIGQLHLDIRKLQEQRLARLEQLRTQALTVLTAEQKQKLADLEKTLASARAARQAAALGLVAPPQPRAGAGPYGMGLRNPRPRRAGGWI